ncbi:multicomponent Na+:H+ antiporter subunit F [Rheinheimera pacifica]|uniref:monovalent cation/H+ antiporter complex subunit F n=1 Tax=Rheinheimera pacifica TaxID=173990 RepID=UPI000CAD7EAB|nr:monovalent cation/H+ antiporter complex subunit F [Rheinheimera pacifica]MDR6982835.1 multicomponent Na+:H+ antiporter subunit F [Rheinheimera pacifica]PKM20136.1 MAG: portal protein [Gammaproteobacteria bacterium HGW-Gammaproteobacteria-15]
MIALAVALLLTMVLGLWRVIKGPALLDRLLSVQLFGTTGVALCLVLAQALGMSALRDVALVLAVLAAAAPAALVQRLKQQQIAQPPSSEDNR